MRQELVNPVNLHGGNRVGIMDLAAASGDLLEQGDELACHAHIFIGDPKTLLKVPNVVTEHCRGERSTLAVG